MYVSVMLIFLLGTTVLEILPFFVVIFRSAVAEQEVDLLRLLKSLKVLFCCSEFRKWETFENNISSQSQYFFHTKEKSVLAYPLLSVSPLPLLSPPPAA